MMNQKSLATYQTTFLPSSPTLNPDSHIKQSTPLSKIQSPPITPDQLPHPTAVSSSKLWTPHSPSPPLSLPTRPPNNLPNVGVSTTRNKIIPLEGHCLSCVENECLDFGDLLRCVQRCDVFSEVVSCVEGSFFDLSSSSFLSCVI